MSKVKPYVLIESLSGKVCQDSDTYFSTRYGRTYSSRLLHPSRAEPSEKQLIRREAFKKATEEVRVIMADKSSEAYIKAKAEWRGQKKYVTLYGYLMGKRLKG